MLLTVNRGLNIFRPLSSLNVGEDLCRAASLECDTERRHHFLDQMTTITMQRLMSGLRQLNLNKKTSPSNSLACFARTGTEKADAWMGFQEKNKQQIRISRL